MGYDPCVPPESDWRWDEIATVDALRAHRLERASSPAALLDALETQLGEAVNRGLIRFGRERWSKNSSDTRAVVQFWISRSLFDWFFNARTGYRAHFRTTEACGRAFNKQIISRLWAQLESTCQFPLSGREVDETFQDLGPAQIGKDFISNSLEPELAKIWFSTLLIEPGAKPRQLIMGLDGARVLIGNTRWAAPDRDEDSTWLDIKGAFLGQSKPHQPKDPECRAMHLRATGEA